jgi:hypothetical protein
MAVNYVKGQILSDILERDGLDISIANANVGINTTTPTVALDVYGNVQANNFNTTGSANTGNITGANVISSVTLCAFGNVYANNLNSTANITGENLNITANVAAGNVLTDHLFYANGTPWDLQEPAGSNTQIQFNNNSQFGATANFIFDTAANLLAVNATANIVNVNVASNAVVQGNVTGGNLLTSGQVSAAGNVYTPRIQNGSTGMYMDAGYPGYINFFNSNGTKVTIDDSGNINGGVVSMTGNVTGGNVLTGGLISATGNITSGNLTIANTVIVATSANSTVTLQPTGTGLVNINTTTGLILPVGNTTQRPGYPTYATTPLATIRYNDNLDYIEYFDGTNWTEVGNGGNTAISDQQITPDGTSVTYTLTQTSDQTSILVGINGINQIPGSAYSVTGNLITFSEAPLTSDAIDIRFLATATTRSRILNGDGTTFVAATDANTVVSNIAGSNVMVVSSTGVSVAGNVITNNISANQSLKLPSYTVAQSANISGPLTGQVIYVSNGDAGNPCLAVYSSGAWKRISLGANISAT